MDIIKKPYELSLWEDVLTFIYEDGEESEEKIIDKHGQVIAQYYKERLICVIGSDTMETPIRAVQSKLVSKVNGENTLTFNMYSHYYDEETEQYYRNPFVDKIINERKIKLRHGAIGAPDTKWYDLVIKNVQQSSDTKTYSYTAKDLFINELSKSGFNLEFHQDLENNTGNIDYLASIILDESDWQLKPSDTIKQTIEEPLYIAKLNAPLTLKDMEKKEQDLEVEAGAEVYIFYDSIINHSPYVQLLYVPNNRYEYDSNYVITNSPNWFVDGVNFNDEIPEFTDGITISDKYRGRRLVRKVKTIYDATIDKYVGVYNKGKIYGYTETEYASPATVRSYVTNASNYESSLGWEVGSDENGGFPALEVVTVPDVRDVVQIHGSESDFDLKNYKFESCLKLNANANQVLYNSGIVDLRHHINGFVEGEEYIFGIKYGENSGDENGKNGAYSLTSSKSNLTMFVAQYNLEEGRYVYTDEDIIFSYTFNGSSSETIYSSPVRCKKSLTYAQMIEMTNQIGLFIQSESKEIYIQDVLFFPYIDKGFGDPLLPNEIKTGEVRTLYYYYEPDVNYKNIEEVRYVYKGEEQPLIYSEDYNDIEYEKIRSITASESNRFNLIQELCEIFECWPKFEIEHKLTGEIELDENYRQKKYISFHEYVGHPNYAGFKYGINLKDIKRTVDSDGIISKLIVKNNSNEFATDGFCSIARATENPNGENFILDFGYYIQQGMMGLSEVTNDLYLENSGWLGYYKFLKRYNTERDIYIKEQSGLLTDISEYQASYQTYNLSATEAEKQYRDKLSLIRNLTGLSFSELAADKDNSWWDNDQVISTTAALGRLRNVSVNHQALAEAADKNLIKAQNRYDWLKRALTDTAPIEDKRLELLEDFNNHIGREITLIMDDGEQVQGIIQSDGRILVLVDDNNSIYYDNIYYVKERYYRNEKRLLVEKQRLHSAFYKKYSRFLQEGSWISEDYIDDNLYYLDAQSTLTTSSRPKISYDISVLELSQIEEYKNYTFALGDETEIEDIEFFGWTWDYSTGIKIPSKESIVVTELTTSLDSPEQNQIKVQNYKSQFEDLFQRMAATTQSVEYSTGKYQKVAGIVETDGTINITTLQNSITNNALTLQNAKDQSVVWDETGITTTSLKNPSEIVRIVSGGVFLSADGGITWNTGITGSGINASYITTGQMNVEEVNILNGSFPSFRWDTSGLSAYEFELNEDGKTAKNFNFGKFIRLDQYGIYGINGLPNFNSALPDRDVNGNIIYENGKQVIGEDKIWKYSNFALTWKGFQIKSNRVKGGYVSITSEKDLQVFDGEGKERIKLGWLNDSQDNPVYGLRINDGAGIPVMEHSSDGKVWIRNELKVGVDTSMVSIGYLTERAPKEILEEGADSPTKYHQVINANDKFIVYENGAMVATDGEFTGTIIATGGKIGNIEIASISNSEYEIAIEVIEGTGSVFEKDSEKTLCAYVYKNGQKFEQIATVELEGILSYQWYCDNKIVESTEEEPLRGKQKTLKIFEKDIPSSASFSCAVEIGKIQ